MSKTETKFSLVGADGIRAFACLSVIIHHLSQRLMIQAQSPQVSELQSFLMLGNTGVSVFFVLSGFLLSFPFWKQFLSNNEFPNMKQYTLRRIARIMPGYYLSFFISTIIIILLGIPTQHFLIRTITGLTFTSGFHYITFFPNELNSPFWSISFEVFCYLLMPVFMFLMFKIIKTKRTFFKSFLFWILVAAVIAILNQIIHLFLTPDDIEKGWQFGQIGGAKYWMPNYNPIGFFGHFLIGIIASGITTKLYLTTNSMNLAKKFYLFDAISIISFIGALLLLWNVRHEQDFALSFQSQPYYFPLYATLFGITLATAPHTKFIGKMFDNPFSKLTAKLSFGIYIWHYLIMSVITNVFVKNYVTFGIIDLTSWATISVIVIVLSYLIAGISYKFLEKPIIDRAHQWQSKIIKTK